MTIFLIISQNAQNKDPVIAEAAAAIKTTTTLKAVLFRTSQTGVDGTTTAGPGTLGDLFVLGGVVILVFVVFVAGLTCCTIKCL